MRILPVIGLGVVTASGFAALHYFGKAELAERDAAQLRHENATQSALIARSAFVFNQFNVITAAHEADRLARNERTVETVIEYREVLRRVPISNELVPPAVAGGLCGYAARLRSAPMRTTTGEPDRSSRDPAPSCKLTYRQAVLWVSPLLAALDEANARLDAIRHADKVRNEPL